MLRVGYVHHIKNGYKILSIKLVWFESIENIRCIWIKYFGIFDLLFFIKLSGTSNYGIGTAIQL